MSRFYASIMGSAVSEAARQGTPTSGINGHVRGWNIGISVHGWADGECDVFEVYLTGGTGSAGSDVWLATVRKTEDGRHVVLNDDAKGNN